MTEVMGGDLALTATGLCLPDGTTVTIKTGGADKGDARLHDMRREFTHWLRSWPCRVCVLEAPGRFRSGDAMIAVGMAHGVYREALAEFRIPRALIAPQCVKQFATGKGNADKPEMVIAANQARLEVVTTLSRTGLSATTYAPPPEGEITDHNQADAWWLRQMGLWYLGECLLPEIGQADTDGRGIRHRAVFGPWPKGGGAKWPDGIRTAAVRS